MPQSILNHPLISRRYFFPRAGSLPNPTWVEVDGARLACGRHDAGPGTPWLVHFHGNGETVSDYLPRAPEAWARRGVSTLFAEYRGYGDATGEPRLVTMLDDVPALVAATGTPPENTYVYGRSVGSIYAIEAAARVPGLAGVILESGIADVLERVLLRVLPDEIGATLEAMKAARDARLNHHEKLAGFDGRTLVLHARGDRTVSLAHAERNAASARDAELEVYAPGDHNTILAYHHDAIIDRVAAFLRSPGPS
ncbi:MAG: alpha/beta hydrolase [Sandaracinaceae bacterium]